MPRRSAANTTAVSETKQSRLGHVALMAVPILAMMLALVQATGMIWPFLQTPFGVRGLFVAATVPSVLGMTVEDARSLTHGQGLEVRVLGRRATDRFPAGVIAHQSPIGGWRPEPGETLRVTVSSGVTVPDLRGKSIDDASTELRSLGWKIGRVDHGSEPSAASGSVYVQHPAPGKVLPEQGEMLLVVAR